MNSTIKTEIMRLLNIKPAGEQIPNVVPVINVNMMNVCVYLDTSGTVYTVPDKGRFFLNACEISYDKTAGDTGTLIRFDIVPAMTGKTTRICHIASVTSVVDRQNKVVSGINIELKPGSTISGALSGTYSNKTYTVYGTYLPE